MDQTRRLKVGEPRAPSTLRSRPARGGPKGIETGTDNKGAPQDGHVELSGAVGAGAVLQSARAPAPALGGARSASKQNSPLIDRPPAPHAHLPLDDVRRIRLCSQADRKAEGTLHDEGASAPPGLGVRAGNRAPWGPGHRRNPLQPSLANALDSTGLHLRARTGRRAETNFAATSWLTSASQTTPEPGREREASEALFRPGCMGT